MILAVMMMATVFSAMAFAEEKTIIDSGYCGAEGDGSNLKWTLDSEGTLTISGTGAMKDYDWATNAAPWANNKESVTSLVLENGITKVGAWAFMGCKSIVGTLVIPSSLQEIGEAAFIECTGFNKIEIENWITNSYFSTDGYILYQYSNRSKLIFGVNRKSGDLVIPNGVKHISDGAFTNCNGFDGELVLPQSIESIGRRAFEGCKGLKGKLEIPDKVTEVGLSAFNGCGFSEIKLSNGISKVERYTFLGCKNLEKVIIPKNIKQIDEFTFSASGDTCDAYFEGDAPEMKTNSFSANTTIYYVEGKAGWTSPTWNGYNTGIWNPETGETTVIVASGYCGAEGDGSNLKWTLNDKGTLMISGTGEMDSYQYYDESDGSTYVYHRSPWAGYADNIKSVVFKEGITGIGNYAFSACKKLECSIVLPESIERIGEFAFDGCVGVTGELVIPHRVKNVGMSSFGNTGITSVTINCEEGIFALSFGYSDSVEKIIVPESNAAYSTDGNMLYDKNKTKVILSLNKVGLIETIPDSVTTIGKFAFGYRNIGDGGDLIIPDNIRTIAEGAFYRCKGFSGSLVIPENVENIGAMAFATAELSDIKDIKVSDSNNHFKTDGDMLYSKDGKKLIFGLGRYNKTIKIPEGVETICAGAFEDGFGFVGKLKIPKTVTEIGTNAFGNCWGIESVYFEGDAPEAVGYKTSMEWPSFPNITLYYIEGKAGWTSPTWNGYNTAKWDGKELYLPGDINGDGKVNNKDVTRLFQYLSGMDVEVVNNALDVNGDGKVNNKDVTRLFQYLSGMDVKIH